ncbi:hypothetical protein [Streptomyces sp. OK228]|uniref:hypothetical protein n=1 Tax=Streptomyces sp. OK228 TaxID=1882786 RepID=UPI000BC4F770|nr:hypothetical protein [Streptomyces sp. OK228]SOE25692.1 hypothetical protein SAMN05442782_2436 [Streptomyces sp. OK228]
MTREQVQKQKAVRRRERGQQDDSGSADRARSRRASNRAAGVTEAARRFLSRMGR